MNNSSDQTNITSSPNPLIIRYVNKYYRAPAHITTEKEFIEYLEKKEREYMEFISSEDLKINYGRFNFINWDGSERIKDELRHIARTEPYELYNYKVDLDYIINYFGFKKKNDYNYNYIENYNKEQEFISNNLNSKKKKYYVNTNTEQDFNYLSNSDNDNDDNDNIIDEEDLDNLDNIENVKEYESDN